jgi:hypothetical protein
VDIVVDLVILADIDAYRTLEQNLRQMGFERGEKRWLAHHAADRDGKIRLTRELKRPDLTHCCAAPMSGEKYRSTS